jgi:hypothetical protein
MSSDFSYNVEVTPFDTVAIPGPVGPSGPSAYAIAVEGGYSGSESDWIASLTGPSAYEIWLDAGNTGTEADFLTSLEGTSAYEEWLAAGNTGSEAAFLASLVGPPGLSAYGVWVQAGNAGTTDDFFAFITGPIGPSGYSAYTIAVQHGFVGTEAQWLASLKGASGTSSWSSLTGVPSTFPPSPHTHPQTDVTNLVAALNSKASASTTVSTGMSVSGGGALSGLASITFVNDRANPGPFAFYGTNNLGGRGWWVYGSAINYNAPAAGDASSSQVVLGSDSRLTNARSPLAHSLSHSFGASDPIQITRAQISDLPGVVSPTSIGFVPALPTTNPATVFFRGDGNYAAPPGGLTTFNRFTYDVVLTLTGTETTGTQKPFSIPANLLPGVAFKFIVEGAYFYAPTTIGTPSGILQFMLQSDLGSGLNWNSITATQDIGPIVGFPPGTPHKYLPVSISSPANNQWFTGTPGNPLNFCVQVGSTVPTSADSSLRMGVSIRILGM